MSAAQGAAPKATKAAGKRQATAKQQAAGKQQKAAEQPAAKRAKPPATGEGEPDYKTIPRKAGLFARDLRLLMYGFGDVEAPLGDSVDLVEDCVVDYIATMTCRGVEQAARAGRPGKLHTNDLICLVRKDAAKLARVQELLRAQEEITEAKRAFQEEM